MGLILLLFTCTYGNPGLPGSSTEVVHVTYPQTMRKTRGSSSHRKNDVQHVIFPICNRQFWLKQWKILIND